VNAEITERLLALNREFYQTFAGDFSATRGRAQPGARRVLDGLRGDEAVIDLGCGNGTLAAELAARGHRGTYLGLDPSPGLLAAARARDPGTLPAHFAQADLSGDWTAQATGPYGLIALFAVLHHLPGADLRLRVLRAARGLLSPDGRLALSVWQFLSSPRLRARVRPWSEAGLRDEDVDPGDHLLDWRQGGRGLRYVHAFDEQELNRLAGQTGFRAVESFRSDGREGDLALYQIWVIN